jgi:hypothetical protein
MLQCTDMFKLTIVTSGPIRQIGASAYDETGSLCASCGVMKRTEMCSRHTS